MTSRKGYEEVKSKRITSKNDLNVAFRIRKEVFVKEQGVSEDIEFDSLDEQCEHVLVYFESQPVGTGRIRPVDGMGKLERICVLQPYRNFGLGKEIIQVLEGIAKEMGISRVKLHGQTQAEKFYQKLGYKTSSGVFMEDGIPHKLMVKDIMAP